jgi:hypothetical protein
MASPMGSLEDIDATPQERELFTFVMVLYTRQRDPAEKPIQGSLFIMLNLSLKLFGFFRDFVIKPERL